MHDKEITMNCPDCQDTRSVLIMKIIPTNREDPYYPKYIPQIKKTCFCGRFQGFEKQTPELIARFNRQLEGSYINYEK